MGLSISIVVLLLLFSFPAHAITDEEVFRNFQFQFVNPGARASAMGNAFIALADDATAAEANPAGLTILTKPEVSFEYRNSRFDSKALNSINNFGVPEGVRQGGELAIFVSSSNDLQTLNRPSFFSFVYPKGRTTFAFSRQEAVRIRGTIGELFEIPFNLGVLRETVSGESDVNVTNWNFSVGRKVTDKLLLGASIRYSDLDWNAETKNSLSGFGASVQQYNTILNDKDHAFACNAGAIYRARSNFFLGVVYKRNAKFSATEIESGIGAKKAGPVENILKIPDVFGFGAAFRPKDTIIISSDFVRIRYSQLLDGFKVGYNGLTDTLTDRNIQFGVSDAWEPHVGAEVIVFWGDLPIAIREGYYRKPSNVLGIRSMTAVVSTDAAIIQTIFASRPAENHVTIGSGLVLPQFQVDWAFDVAKSADNFIVSTVFRF